MKKQTKHIHFVGVKGVGVAPLAIIAKETGYVVSGCDVADVFITDDSLKSAGIEPLVGFSADHLENVSMVITTGAHGGFDNPEVKAAKEKGIHVVTQGEAVGLFMDGGILGKKGQVGISIAGTHGKTTTTAIIATILKHAKLDPSFIVGTSHIPSLGSSGHSGRGKYFVAEADEYATEPTYVKKTKFLWQYPKIAVFTNLELDHPDVYQTVDHMREAFLLFAKQLPNDGLLVVCGDDPQIQKLLKGYEGRVITYGMSPKNNYVVHRVRVSEQQMFFWVDVASVTIGEFMLRVTGEHNALNATAAIIVASELGLSIDTIKKGLMMFTGTKRRLEKIGFLQSGAELFDDYAHHPTEIKKTLASIRLMYPKKKIVCIFQPHTYSRTKTFFHDFVGSFDSADTVVIADIYPSLREEPDSSVSSGLMVAELSKRKRDVIYLPRLTDVVEYIEQKRYRRDSIVVTMGAGDIYKVLQQLQLAHE